MQPPPSPCALATYHALPSQPTSTHPPFLDIHTYIDTLFTFIPTYLFPSFSKTHTTPTHTQYQRRVIGASFFSLRACHTSRHTHQPHADPTPSSASKSRSDDALAVRPQPHLTSRQHAPRSAMLTPRQRHRTSP
ncbi:hypothetical protein FIBSPDRAFT_877464, partial [Athelia psychrophila]